jgi:hypothetical protein
VVNRPDGSCPAERASFTEIEEENGSPVSTSAEVTADQHRVEAGGQSLRPVEAVLGDLVSDLRGKDGGRAQPLRCWQALAVPAVFDALQR